MWLDRSLSATSLFLNMLSRSVITFLPRSKCLLISWLHSPSAVILEPKEIKSVSIVSPSMCHELMGLNAMILVFWMLSFKPAFSLSSFSCSVMANSLWPHGLQHRRLPCPSLSPGVCSSLYPLSQWCHPTISSSVIPFSSCLQSFPASGSFPVSQFLASGGQSIGVSALASVLPMNIQDWFPLGWTG